MFPKIGVPQNRWFIMENPIKMDDLGGKPTIFGNIHMLIPWWVPWIPPPLFDSLSPALQPYPYLTFKKRIKTAPWRVPHMKQPSKLLGPVALRRHNNFRSIGRWGWGGKIGELSKAPESSKNNGQIVCFYKLFTKVVIGCFIPLTEIIMKPTFISTLVFQNPSD